MIIEIGKPSENLYGSIIYNTNKVSAGVATVVYSSGLPVNLSGSLYSGELLEGFMNFIPQTHNVRNIGFHASINPSQLDGLNEQEVSNIAARYLEEMGYGGQPYLLFRHNDIDREHYHLVSIRVRPDGSKVPDSNEWIRTLAFRRRLEKELGLVPAEKQARRQEAEQGLKKVDLLSGNLQAQMATLIKQASEYRFQTFGEFRHILRQHNIDVEEVKGEHNGEAYHGLVYTPLNDEGNPASKPISASKFSKQMRVDAKELNRRYAATRLFFRGGRNGKDERGNKLLEGLRNKIHEALTPDLDQFKERLHRKGVDLVLHSSTDGRVYGVTYIDRISRTAVKGSQLGREYGAAQLDRLLESSRERWNKQEQAVTNLRTLLTRYRFTSHSAYVNLLRTQGYSLEFNYGLVYVNEAGDRFRATDLGGEFTMEGLKKVRRENESRLCGEEMRQLADHIRQAGKESDGDQSVFLRQLEQLGIDVLPVTDEQGIAKGLTYVDHELGLSVNGYELSAILGPEESFSPGHSTDLFDLLEGLGGDGYVATLEQEQRRKRRRRTGPTFGPVR